MSELSSENIAHLSRLARIRLTPEEESRFAGQLSSVVEYIEQLSAVDVSNVSTPMGVSGLQNVYGEDVERTATDPCSVDREILLAGSPAHHNGYIEVRSVMGDGEEVVGA